MYGRTPVLSCLLGIGLLFRVKLQELLVSASNPIPEDCEGSVAAHVVAVVEVMTVRTTLEREHVVWVERETKTGVRVHRLEQADHQPQPEHVAVRAHQDGAQDGGERVRENVLDRVGILGENANGSLRFVVFLMNVLVDRFVVQRTVHPVEQGVIDGDEDHKVAEDDQDRRKRSGDGQPEGLEKGITKIRSQRHNDQMTHQIVNDTLPDQRRFGERIRTLNLVLGEPFVDVDEVQDKIGKTITQCVHQAGSDSKEHLFTEHHVQKMRGDDEMLEDLTAHSPKFDFESTDFIEQHRFVPLENLKKNELNAHHLLRPHFSHDSNQTKAQGHQAYKDITCKAFTTNR